MTLVDALASVIRDHERWHVLGVEDRPPCAPECLTRVLLRAIAEGRVVTRERILGVLGTYANGTCACGVKPHAAYCGALQTADAILRAFGEVGK